MSLVESVTTINTLGEVFKRSVTEFDIAYRKVVPQHKGEYFIGANLKFPPAFIANAPPTLPGMALKNSAPFKS
jgi:hypothetical protein